MKRTPSHYLLCTLTLLGSVFWMTVPAFAGPLTAGGSYQFEDHSGENHRNETLDGIDLSFGTFAGTNLSGTSLIGAVFVQTDFTGANLRGTNFTRANLTDATLSPGVNLRNANLTNANLVGVDLTGINITNAIFVGAAYDATTILTFDPVAAGMTPVPEQSPVLFLLLGLTTFAGIARRTSIEAAQPHSA